MHITPFGEKHIHLNTLLAINMAECLLPIKFCIVLYICHKHGNSKPHTNNNNSSLQIKVNNSNDFLFLNQNICGGYSKEQSQ